MSIFRAADLPSGQRDASSTRLVCWVWDALTARLAEAAGVDGVVVAPQAIALSQGYATARTITWTEVLEVAWRVRLSVDIPVVLDCLTGFGNYLNAQQAAREAIQLGVDAIQVGEERDVCAPASGGGVPIREAVAKISAVQEVLAGTNVRLVTQVASSLTLDSADLLERCGEYVRAGASVLQTQALEPTKGEALDGQQLLPLQGLGVPLWGLAPGSPRIAGIGAEFFAATVLPLRIQVQYFRGTEAILRKLATTGTVAGVPQTSTDFMTGLLGLSDIRKMEQSYESQRESEWTPW